MMEYSRPPVFEAGIEARLAIPLSDDDLARADRVFASHYDTRVEELEFEFKVEVGAQAEVKGKTAGYQFTSLDAADICVVKRDGLLVARRAPYQGWESLEAATAKAWTRWLKVIGKSRKFQRLGIRFQNRIDVPQSAEGRFSPHPYVAVLPERPSVLSGNADSFLTQLGGVRVGDYMANLTIGLMPSPLIGHAGILVDIDVFVSKTMNHSDLLDMLEGVRQVKNSVFESVVTDAARELFRG